MPPLLAKQAAFAHWAAILIQQAESLGYQVTLGEVWRPPQMTAIYAAEGTGIKHSNHLLRLAIDINLFKDEKLLTKSEDYKPLGDWWELQIYPPFKFIWGGNFKHLPDGNHFSFENEGVR